jgi:hypothetical protein
MPDTGLMNRLKVEPQITLSSRLAADNGYALKLPLGRSGGLPSGLVLTATFDRCAGASPTNGDFACTVSGCGVASDCTCSAVVR